MSKYFYVYYSYEEFGRGYIGKRECKCLPKEDVKYFGTYRDRTFKPTQKIILEIFASREEVMDAEIKLHNFYENRISFDWEDNKSRGSNSSIKFFDIYNDSLTITIRSNRWGIKDKSYERNLRLNELLPEDKTSEENVDIK